MRTLTLLTSAISIQDEMKTRTSLEDELHKAADALVVHLIENYLQDFDPTNREQVLAVIAERPLLSQVDVYSEDMLSLSGPAYAIVIMHHLFSREKGMFNISKMPNFQRFSDILTPVIIAGRVPGDQPAI